jgi:hypothetical protein
MKPHAHSLLLILLMTLAGCSVVGSAIHNDGDIHLIRSQHVMEIINAPSGGDYALYYAGDKIPEIPVRVNQGDQVGFFTDKKTGKIKAIAGSFKMDLNDEKNEAFWRRMESK